MGIKAFNDYIGLAPQGQNSPTSRNVSARQTIILSTEKNPNILLGAKVTWFRYKPLIPLNVGKVFQVQVDSKRKNTL